MIFKFGVNVENMVLLFVTAFLFSLLFAVLRHIVGFESVVPWESKRDSSAYSPSASPSPSPSPSPSDGSGQG